MTNLHLGIVLSGSLTDGLSVRLNPEVPLEKVKAGKYLCISDGPNTFFALVTDISLETIDPEILLSPPDPDETLLMESVQRSGVFVKVKLQPVLILDENKNYFPVKTIPRHFAPVSQALPEDLVAIFGSEEKKGRFQIGTPSDMEVPVCLDLMKFVDRSNGIFGKTGTGKTFITRLILAGLVKTNTAVNLIFDMHNEYGLQARTENKNGTFVKGLKTLFPSKVSIFSLDPEGTRKRGCSPDVEVSISLDEIRVEDVMALSDELSLHPTAIEAAYLIVNKFGKDWLKVLLSQEGTIKEFKDKVGAHEESLGALYRKLKRIERFPFIKPSSDGKSVIDEMINYLDRGIHVVFEFGTHTSMLSYLLVSGIITRRIHERYVKKTEKFLSTRNKSDEPKKLMITIEEAHKFLNPQAARQTIFGTIAREMRKYYVSLLVVDQRPSGIDSEVLSQIGTKIVAQLNDDNDIHAVLNGVSNAGSIRSILATLDYKKQALVIGHSVPMPILIKTREYDEKFYSDLNLEQKSLGQLEKKIEAVF